MDDTVGARRRGRGSGSSHPEGWGSGPRDWGEPDYPDRNPLEIAPDEHGKVGVRLALALRYDSGVGHGVPGLGWNFGLPSINRGTDKGVPTYDGPEVPPRSGGRDFPCSRIGHASRICTRALSSGDIHWRSIGRDNATTVYRRNSNSRIADLAGRIFTWLISASRDEKGDAVECEYLEENTDHILTEPVSIPKQSTMQFVDP